MIVVVWRTRKEIGGCSSVLCCNHKTKNMCVAIEINQNIFVLQLQQIKINQNRFALKFSSLPQEWQKLA